MLPRRLTALLALLATTAAGKSPVPADHVVVRADVRDDVLLTGELDAVSAATLEVPRTSEWLIQLRWLEADGTPVKAGQKVAEFDNAAFVADLSEKKLAAIQAADDLEKQRDQNGIATLDKAFDADKAKSDLETAKLSAALEKDSLPARVWQENQLDLERKATAYAKARDDLGAQQRGSALDLQVKQIALDKSRREIQAAEEAIAKVELRAPRDGVVVIANNPREGRKLEVGDTIWVGLPVVRLPDLSTMRVKAALSDVDDGRVAIGMKARVTLDAYPDHEIEGTVSAISPVAREPSPKSPRRSFEVTIALAEENHAQLLPGLSAKVEILGREVHDVLVAPRTAIDFDARPVRLTTADGGGLEIEVGLCDTQRCEIRPPGDAPAGPLAPGLRLRTTGGGA